VQVRAHQHGELRDPGRVGVAPTLPQFTGGLLDLFEIHITSLAWSVRLMSVRGAARDRLPASGRLNAVGLYTAPILSQNL
jgi:hypothetical protein